MPAPFPIQTSFAAGEVSPRLRGRVDSKPYQQGLAECDNFVPMPQGSLMKREGLELVAAPIDTAGFRRLLRFKSANLDRYQVSLTNGRLRVFTPSGVLGLLNSELVVNGDCNVGGGGWTFVSSARLHGYAPMQYILLITNGAAEARQSIAGVAAGTYVFRFRASAGARKVGGLTIPTQLKVKIGTTLGGVDVLPNTTISSDGEFLFTITLGGTSTLYINFMSNDTGLVPQAVTVDEVSLRSTTAATFIAAPWQAEDIPDVQFVTETGRDRMILAHPKYEPRVLSRASTGIWALQTLTAAGGAGLPASWAGSNYPAVVEIHQGRLWLAATPAKMNTFWASKPFSYDFTTGLTAGDGFSYDVAVKGQIRWMRGQKMMLVGADDGEHSISASDGVVYTGNIEIRQESAFGSAKLQAISIGDQVVFVSADRRKVRAMAYSLEGGGWYARDITFTAEHITGARIVEMAFARDPLNTLVLCLEDGSLACCNYDRVEQLAGWFTCHFSGALIRSVSPMDQAEGTEIWVTAEVSDSGTAADGTPFRFLAKWPLFETAKPKIDLQRTLNSTLQTPAGTLALNAATMVLTASNPIFHPGGEAALGTEVRFLGLLGGWYGVLRVLDITGDYTALVERIDEWAVTGDVPATSGWQYDTALLSFGHRWWNGSGMYNSYPLCPDGFSVVVVDRETDAISWLPWGLTYSGALPVNISDGYSVAVKKWEAYELTSGTYTAGLPFTASAVTLPIEGGNPAGSAQGMNVHRADVTLRLNDSALPQANGATVQPPTNRFAGDTGGLVMADPLLYLRMSGDRFTEDATAKPQSRSSGGIITITQELPWRTEICALFGNVQMSKV